MSIRKYLPCIYNIIRHGRFGLPDAIAVEVSTACNYRCDYCPQSTDPRPQKIISDDLWHLFLEELREIKWRGNSCLTLYNELSIIPDSERYVKELAETGARVLLFSNGSKPDVIEKWMQAGAAKVLITEHPSWRPEWSAPIQELKDKWGRRILVRKLQPHEMSARAGLVDVDAPPMYKCYLCRSLTVNVDGDAYLCCNDYYGGLNLGNLRDQSLLEIWGNPRFERIRREARKGNAVINLCRKCLTPIGQDKPKDGNITA